MYTHIYTYYICVCLFVLVYLEYFEHLKYFTLGFEAY